MTTETTLVKPGFKLPNLPFLKKRQTFVRRHSRHDCFIVGTMELSERRVVIDGTVMELSLGGLLFRPAASFILERAGDEVEIEFADIKIAGKLMNTRPVGYGIKFDKVLDGETFDRLVAAYGLAQQPPAPPEPAAA